MTDVVSAPAVNRIESRVLILAPTANDARLTATFLEKQNDVAEVCDDLPQLCMKVEEGCGMLLLAEETLLDSAVPQLVGTLARQPPWSDLPIAIITSGGEVSQARLRRLGVFGPGGNVTLLERPFRPSTLVSSVEVALRARRRQYEVRGLLQKLQVGEERLTGILDSISDAFIALDRDWRITYVNPSYVRLVAPLFRSEEELLGQNLWEKFPDLVGSDIAAFYGKTMAEQRPGAIEMYYEPLRAWLDIRAYPTPQMLSIYARDISERKKQEARLATLSLRIAEQSRVFDQTLSNITDFAYTFDRDGRFIYANKPLLDLWGLTLDHAAGKNFFDLHYPDEVAAKLQRQIAEVFETGRPVRDETPYTSPSGGEGYYEYIFSPVFNPDGGVEIVAGSTRDTTERKRREAEVEALTRKIEAQANLFDATLSNIADLAYSFDREGRVIYANRSLLELWGKDMAEVVGRTLFELDYPGELARKLHSQLMEVIATGSPIRGENVFRSSAGVEDIHDYIFNPVFDKDGRVGSVAGTTRLVTENRRAEGAMRQLAAIVESSDDAIISKDLDGVITSWNAGAERLFGYTAAEVIGRPVTILIPEDRHDEEPNIVARIRRGQAFSHYETQRLRKDGSLVPISLSVSPIKDRDGNIIGASKIARDITDQKKAEQALKEARDAAESANRSKDHFLAVLSHELRTPLTPVLMMASALEMDPLIPASLRGDMAVIRRNVELETKLIDDLLDLSRITTGKLALHRRVVDVNEAVREVCAICASQIDEKGVRLEMMLGEHSGHVRADPARMQQILWNVIKNAVKFTPAGGTIRVETSVQPGDVARIAVSDTGIGIAAPMLSKIFDAFEQGDSCITKQFGGLGLGLAITKALVELHEGGIRAESGGEGRGSTFFIELPVAVADSPSSNDLSATKPKNDALQILIAEDHADTGMMLGRLLRAAGFDVTVATSASGAMEQAAAQDFDFVISDIGLPDASGYDLMRGLRERRPGIKGIAMSGYGMEEDVRRSLEAGFSEHIVKPVNLLSLEQAIRRHAPRH